MEKIKQGKSVMLNVFFFIYFILIFFQTIQGLSISQFVTAQDLFINYRGGFVRRGLLGEIILGLYEKFGIAPELFIQSLSVFSFLFVVVYVVIKFKKLNLNPYVLFSFYGLAGVAISGMAYFRRDYIMFVFMVLVVMMFEKVKLKAWFIFSNVVTIFAILCHEAYFLYSVPAFIFMTYSKSHNFYKSVFMWIPSIIAFLIVCFFKGDANVASKIWESVRPIYNGGHEKDMPMLIEFIGKSSKDAFVLHLKSNFLGHCYKIPTLVLTIVTIWLSFYTVSSIPFINNGDIDFRRRKFMGVVLFCQFICLLPMFTVLSCDRMRVFIYWILSSIILYISIKEKFSEFLLSKIEEFPLLSRSIEYVDAKMMLHKSPKISIGLLSLFIVGSEPFTGSIVYFFNSSILGNSINFIISLF